MGMLVNSGMKRVNSSFATLRTNSTDSDDEERPEPLKNYVDGLRDFSDELKAMGVYMADYTNWRRGRAKGARGEAIQVMRQVNRSYLQDAMMKDAEEPSDIFCFRQEYKAWRHSRSKGNRVS